MTLSPSEALPATERAGFIDTAWLATSAAEALSVATAERADFTDAAGLAVDASSPGTSAMLTTNNDIAELARVHLASALASAQLSRLVDAEVVAKALADPDAWPLAFSDAISAVSAEVRRRDAVFCRAEPSRVSPDPRKLEAAFRLFTATDCLGILQRLRDAAEALAAGAAPVEHTTQTVAYLAGAAERRSAAALN